MRPILLQGHVRFHQLKSGVASLTSLLGAIYHSDKVASPRPRSEEVLLLTDHRYNKDGDLLFSTAKDHVVCAWFSANGERMGTYHGHQGALWTVDVDPSTTLLASGGADNTARLWDVKTGKCLMTWEFPTAVKRVEFSEDGTQLLAVTEKRMGHLGTIVVFDITVDVNADQTKEPSLRIVCEESKATVAGWSYLSRYIIAGHEDGSVSQYDGKASRFAVSVGCHGMLTLGSTRRANNSTTFRPTTRISK